MQQQTFIFLIHHLQKFIKIQRNDFYIHYHLDWSSGRVSGWHFGFDPIRSRVAHIFNPTRVGLSIFPSRRDPTRQGPELDVKRAKYRNSNATRILFNYLWLTFPRVTIGSYQKWADQVGDASYISTLSSLISRKVRSWPNRILASETSTPRFKTTLRVSVLAEDHCRFLSKLGRCHIFMIRESPGRTWTKTIGRSDKW